jgi:Fe-S oxidoreductase
MTTQEAVDIVELYIIGPGPTKEPIHGDYALAALRVLEAAVAGIAGLREQAMGASIMAAQLAQALEAGQAARDELDRVRALRIPSEASRLAMGQSDE